jgi:hypothetical protein
MAQVETNVIVKQRGRIRVRIALNERSHAPIIEGDAKNGRNSFEEAVTYRMSDGKPLERMNEKIQRFISQMDALAIQKSSSLTNS